ncbi:transcription factor IIIA [Microcaecilia unicolor]|uniref:Transcription factor IIIA n=1 Tax=Microcaecilia unicolor TaxID=1415580 RepID=A0A6P7Y068_9AMPH|nr:transcription factor IIIA [Microcaecilia unicolor]
MTRFICSFPDCDASFNKNWKLNAHLCKHTGETPFVCQDCGKGFTRSCHLSRHLLIHTGEKPFWCTVDGCNEKFALNSNLKKHIGRKHDKQGKQYVCDFEGCGKSFKKHKQLKAHRCQHTNELPFKCEHEGCGKCFFLPSKLKRHEKVHEGYACKKDNCLFVGTTWTEYLKHMRSCHVEEVICQVCSKKFKRKDYLKEHQKIHATDRELYRCPREGCERAYSTVFNVQNHIMSFHEEMRPYICEVSGCGKSFAMKQSLDRHSVAHDPEKRKLKVKRPRPKRSLASRLAGYIPPKATSEITARLESGHPGGGDDPPSVETLTLC